MTQTKQARQRQKQEEPIPIGTLRTDEVLAWKYPAFQDYPVEIICTCGQKLVFHSATDTKRCKCGKLYIGKLNTHK